MFQIEIDSFTAALKCHVCNSKEDSRCLDPMDENNGLPLMNCTSDEQQRAQTRKAIEEISALMTKLGQTQSMSFSTKKVSQLWEDEKFPMVCQKLELEVEGNLVIGRGCSAPRMENFDPCYAVKLITSKDIVLKSCSLCDTDGCNAGFHVTAGLLPGFLALILTTYVIT
ncbi:hypothetical protein RUM44_010290 [Polyplax serrata]|uniref:Protein quiver n=1 Tax=Polyplax serrata TaxID=468196 RepID=A0ABR1AV55_POLSC